MILVIGAAWLAAFIASAGVLMLIVAAIYVRAIIAMISWIFAR
jgi:hypothetical protein